MYKLIAMLFLAATGIGSTASQSEPARPLIVAHRGASFDAPENTMAAFRLAWEQNADAIEGDFYLTADGKVVTLHDATFKRTAGVDRKPSDMTLQEIRALDVGSWKDSRFAGERAPTIDEVLAIVPAGKLFLIEIKCGPEILPALKASIDASGISASQLRIISFKAPVIAEAKKLMPAIKAYWLTGFKKEEGHPHKTPTLETILKTLQETRADGLDVNADLDVIDDAFVSAIRAKGHELHFWTVDQPDVAKRLIDLGADSITTNRPAYLREAISQ